VLGIGRRWLESAGELVAGGGGVGFVALDAAAEDVESGVGEPVVAAEASVDDLLAIDRQHTFSHQSVQRGVEGARAQPDTAVGEPVDRPDDPVAMEWLRRHGRQDQEARLPHGGHYIPMIGI
jgi:hypothetical protein